MNAVVYEVVRWQKTGPNSVSGSGAVRCVGWAAVGKLSKKWIERGPDFYVSVARFVDPFAASRGIYKHEPDWLCLTERGGCLDAPDYIAGGSMKCFGCAEENSEFRAPYIVSRGFWI